MAHIPHMGGKQVIAKNLIDVMLFHNPEADTFVDVFGGGGSMSFEALSRPQIKRVIYNELNTGVVALLDKVMADGVTPEFYEWISRERFYELVKGDCWKAGLVKNLWSFGNNQRNYLYGSDVENYKKAYHDLVVSGLDTRKSMQRYAQEYVLKKHGINEPCFIQLPTANGIQERRLQVRGDLNKYKKTCKLTQIRLLEQLQHLERLERLQHLEQLQQLQQLQQLEHLQHLQQLERLPTHGLITSNKSYEQLDLSQFENAIIYCDPPYAGTVEYQDKFNNTVFFDWFKNYPQKMYLSEYDAPFKCVYEKEKRVTMSATNNKLKKIEKLYVNHD